MRDLRDKIGKMLDSFEKMDEPDLNQQSDATIRDCFYVGDSLHAAYGYDLKLHLCHVPNVSYYVDSRIYDVFTDELVGFIKPSLKIAFLSYYNGPVKDLFSKSELKKEWEQVKMRMEVDQYFIEQSEAIKLILNK